METEQKHEPELEQWLDEQASIWADDEHVDGEAQRRWDALIDGLERQHRTDRLEYRLGQGAIALSMLITVATALSLFLIRGKPWFGAAVLMYLPLGGYLMHRLKTFWAQKLAAYSGQLAQDAVGRLEQYWRARAAEMYWGQRILPACMAFVVGLVLWSLFSAPKPLSPRLLIAIVTCAGIFAGSAYVLYVRQPKQLGAEREALDKIIDELTP